MNNTILVVEDDENLRLALIDNLQLEGYRVHSAATLAHAKDCINQTSIDLCILDIMLPDGNGYHFSQWLRSNKHQTLILMLTARVMESDLEQGFESGADDYVNKPYRLKELLLRIKALLRRAGDTQLTEITSINGFDVTWSARQIKREGKTIHLTKKEFDLLTFLFSNLNKARSRDDILTEVWGKGLYVDNRTVDNFISSLKKLLNLNGEHEYYIETIRGVGYCLHKNL